RIGPQRYYPHIHDFGFGEKTGVDLAGEVPGQVVFPTDKGWSPSNLVTNAFGQGIAVTPLQLVAAASAVANHGLMVKPRAVTAIRDSAGIHPIAPIEVRRVLPPDVAATLTHMLIDSAKIGEAQLAVVPGFNVAAKTGTAQVASPKGGYAEGKFVASLLGFAPADAPKFVMLVKIDEPQGVPFGAEVAAPVWRELAKQLFVHFRIEPTDPAALARSAPKPTAVPTHKPAEAELRPAASPRPRPAATKAPAKAAKPSIRATPAKAAR
ncbi:MAG: peptidoglycan glycosyltransferase, partial [Chloroflexota bacterium]|nr:peptidoglycan glycosyltransferase [Chloroflexota bacterium]